MSDDLHPTMRLRWRSNHRDWLETPFSYGSWKSGPYVLQQYFENHYADRATGKQLPGEWRDVQIDDSSDTPSEKQP